jgi:hypothetical protein
VQQRRAHLAAHPLPQRELPHRDGQELGQAQHFCSTNFLVALAKARRPATESNTAQTSCTERSGTGSSRSENTSIGVWRIPGNGLSSSTDRSPAG